MFDNKNNNIKLVHKWHEPFLKFFFHPIHVWWPSYTIQRGYRSSVKAPIHYVREKQECQSISRPKHECSKLKKFLLGIHFCWQQKQTDSAGNILYEVLHNNKNTSPTSCAFRPSEVVERGLNALLKEDGWQTTREFAVKMGCELLITVRSLKFIKLIFGNPNAYELSEKYARSTSRLWVEQHAATVTGSL